MEFLVQSFFQLMWYSSYQKTNSWEWTLTFIFNLVIHHFAFCKWLVNIWANKSHLLNKIYDGTAKRNEVSDLMHREWIWKANTLRGRSQPPNATECMLQFTQHIQDMQTIGWERRSGAPGLQQDGRRKAGSLKVSGFCGERWKCLKIDGMVVAQLCEYYSFIWLTCTLWVGGIVWYAK